MKILLAVDGSEFTQQVLAYLAAHDDRLGRQNEFTILTVVPPVPPQVTHFVDQETLKGHYQQIAEDVLRPVRSFAVKQQWNVAIKHLVGPAAETIARCKTPVLLVR
jgi:hypothetical protein